MGYIKGGEKMLAIPHEEKVRIIVYFFVLEMQYMYTDIIMFSLILINYESVFT